MAERTPAEILRSARKRIEDEQAWCQGQYACDAYGKCVDPDDRAACSWDSAGALLAERGGAFPTKDLDQLPELLLLAAAVSTSPPTRLHDALMQIVNFNEVCTHADALALYDRAIQLAEECNQ